MTLRSPGADILKAAIKTFYEEDFPSLRCIDSGAEAITYKGRSAIYGDVCVKRFHSKALLAPGSKREVQSLLKHSFHPNIVRVLGFYEEDINSQGQVGYVMEFMAGGSLHSAIYSGEDYLEKDAYNWIIQAARGLQYLHEANIIHRDVKPKNMLLDKQRETLKLSDFGLAKSVESLTVANIGGTVPYMAPELISQGGKAFGTASDVYALGISMLEIFQRQAPYGGQAELALLSKVRGGERPIIKGDLDPAVAQLLRKTWDPDPRQRCTIMDIVVFANGKLDERPDSPVPAERNTSSAPHALSGMIEQTPDTLMYTPRPNSSYPGARKETTKQSQYVPASSDTFVEQSPDSLIGPTASDFITPPADGLDHPMPIICVLSKTKQEDEYGFNLRRLKDRNVFLIGNVDAGGIAERAGLRTQQLIVGINGTIIYPDISQPQMSRLMKKVPLSVTLLVASEDVAKWYKINKQEFSFDKARTWVAHPSEQPEPPALPHRASSSQSLLSSIDVLESNLLAKQKYVQFLLALALSLPSTAADHYMDTLDKFIANCMQEYTWHTRQPPAINKRRTWIGRSDGTTDSDALKRIAWDIDQATLDKETAFGAHVNIRNFSMIFYCNPKKFTAETKEKLIFMEEFVKYIRRALEKYKEQKKSTEDKPQLNCLIVGNTVEAEKFFAAVAQAIPTDTRNLYRQKFFIFDIPSDENIVERSDLIREKISRIGEVHSVLLLLDSTEPYGQFEGPTWKELIPNTVPILCHKEPQGISGKTAYQQYLENTFYLHASDIVYNQDTQPSISTEDTCRILYLAYARSLIVMKPIRIEPKREIFIVDKILKDIMLMANNSLDGIE